jgi:hypothetical protein
MTHPNDIKVLCDCGCGEAVTPSPYPSTRRRFVHGHNARLAGPRIAFRVNRKTECWEWDDAISVKGYGRCIIERRSAQAHRVVYEMMRGPVPDGLELDHLCCVRHCVNPDHLEPVTHAENLRRARARHVSS